MWALSATWIQDLRDAWEEFASYADLSMKNNPVAGESCMKIERNHAENDWLIQHSKCSQDDAVVHQGADGQEVCQRCFDNASDQRWLDQKPFFIFFRVFPSPLALGLHCISGAGWETLL